MAEQYTGRSFEHLDGNDAGHGDQPYSGPFNHEEWREDADRRQEAATWLQEQRKLTPVEGALTYDQARAEADRSHQQ